MRFDVLIKSALARDEIVYAGFSAAAFIAFNNRKGLEIIDDPHDIPSGYDTNIVWNGLELISFALAVDFKSDHPESESVDCEIAVYEANGIPYRTLRDGEALIVHDHQQRIVGARNDR